MSAVSFEMENAAVEAKPSALKSAWDNSKTNVVRGTLCLVGSVVLVGLMAATQMESPRALIAAGIGLIAGVVHFAIFGVKMLIGLAKS